MFALGVEFFSDYDLLSVHMNACVIIIMPIVSVIFVVPNFEERIFVQITTSN